MIPGQDHTNGSLDAASRTLLVEVQVANPDGALLPGMYTTVTFMVHRSDPPFLVPDASLVVTSGGTSVAVLVPLNPEEHRTANSVLDPKTLQRARVVHFQKVLPGRDYGTTLEILDGLRDDQVVAVSPGDAVKEGAIVQVPEPAPGAGTPSQGAGK